MCVGRRLLEAQLQRAEQPAALRALRLAGTCLACSGCACACLAAASTGEAAQRLGLCGCACLHGRYRRGMRMCLQGRSTRQVRGLLTLVGVLQGQLEQHNHVTRMTHTDGVPRGWRKMRGFDAFAEDADPVSGLSTPP